MSLQMVRVLLGSLTVLSGVFSLLVYVAVGMNTAAIGLVLLTAVLLALCVGVGKAGEHDAVTADDGRR